MVVECAQQDTPDRIGTIPAAASAMLTALALGMTVVIFARDRTNARRSQAEQVYAFQSARPDTGEVRVMVANRSKLPVYDLGVRLRDDGGFVNAPLDNQDGEAIGDDEAQSEGSEGQSTPAEAARREAGGASSRRQEGDNLLHGNATTGPWRWTLVIEDTQTPDDTRPDRDQLMRLTEPRLEFTDLAGRRWARVGATLKRLPEPDRAWWQLPWRR